MHAFRHGEIYVSCPALEDFLFVCRIGRINPRIRVVLAEHSHACKTRERVYRSAQGARRIAGRSRESVRPNRPTACCRTREDGPLLDTIGGD